MVLSHTSGENTEWCMQFRATASGETQKCTPTKDQLFIFKSLK